MDESMVGIAALAVTALRFLLPLIGLVVAYRYLARLIHAVEETAEQTRRVAELLTPYQGETK